MRLLMIRCDKGREWKKRKKGGQVNVNVNVNCANQVKLMVNMCHQLTVSIELVSTAGYENQPYLHNFPIEINNDSTSMGRN